MYFIGYILIIATTYWYFPMGQSQHLYILQLLRFSTVVGVSYEFYSPSSLWWSEDGLGEFQQLTHGLKDSNYLITYLFIKYKYKIIKIIKMTLNNKILLKRCFWECEHSEKVCASLEGKNSLWDFLWSFTFRDICRQFYIRSVLYL